ncbi:MAG TPA: DUF5683 domain-containing protein [Puia sp.]|nr:DUF5683 domain-containing protein [Puia sp.]
MRQAFFIFFFTGLFLSSRIHAQHTDTLIVNPQTDSILEKKDNQYSGKKMSQAERDSIDKRLHDNPRRATLYSAILPGAGQVYNKKYWKVPIVYTALGIPAYAFFFNKSWYVKCQYALTVCINLADNGSVGDDSLKKVAPELLPFVTTNDQNGIITNRDSFRKNEDYSVLFFLLFYALNIVDATVDAHLKDFNVNSDLSFQIKPMIMPGPTPSAGITIAFNFHKPRFRELTSH